MLSVVIQTFIIEGRVGGGWGCNGGLKIIFTKCSKDLGAVWGGVCRGGGGGGGGGRGGGAGGGEGGGGGGGGRGRGGGGEEDK